MEAEYEPATWDVLRQKMDRMLLEEQPEPVSEVDKAVFHTLQNMEMPYQPAHWDMLATKMTEAARLRRRLWIGKMAEAAIFLLLLINIDGLIDMGSGERTRPDRRVRSNRPQVDASTPAQKHRQYAATLGAQLQNEHGYVATTDEYSAAMNPAATFISAVLQTNDINTQQLFPGENLNDQTSGASGVPHVSDFFAFLSAPDASPVKFTHRFKMPVFPVKPARTEKLYAVSYGTFNRNFVKTDGETRTANGYGNGIAVGYRKGKWSVEAGLGYTQVGYQPKKEVEIYAGNLQNGYVGTYANRVDADVFSVPVRATRRLARVGRTNVYAVAGVTGNISVQKSYQYKTVSYGTGPSAQPGGNPDQPSQPQLSRKGIGWLEENGKIAGNFYATADVGVRVQHPAGKRFAAFVEPVYHQSLGQSGIGPKLNRINTLSVNAGIVASL